MIYIDTPAAYPFRKKRGTWSHLCVDKNIPLSVLHDFAKSRGIKKHWFHNNKRFPHYDIHGCDVETLLNEVTLVSSRELVKLCARG